MRTRSLIALGLLLGTTFLLAGAPAWLLGKALAHFAPGAVTLTQEQGSLWKGRAQAQVRMPNGAMLHLGPLEWRLQPLKLLTGKLAAHINAPSILQGARAQTDVTVGVDGIPRLSDLRAQLPAPMLAQFAPQLKLMQPQGNIELSSPALKIQTPVPLGDIAVTWRGFATKLSKVNPLGDYKLDASLSAGPINFKLASPAGPLLIEGSGSWSQATRLNFDGNARLAPGAPAELTEIVRLFGRDQGGGIYAISLKNF